MGKYVVNKKDNGASFNLVAGNGEIIGRSEFYTTEAACLNGIESVRRNAVEAGVEDQTVEGFEKLKHPKFEIFKDKRDEFRFRLKATNGEIILASEGYTAKASCKNGIDSVVRNADSPVVNE
ncbi:MAG: YegP family protein [Erysipelotrichaceae bacterium]|jgi:uncharacterized protein YegP (UPF0339 family)